MDHPPHLVPDLVPSKLQNCCHLLPAFAATFGFQRAERDSCWANGTVDPLRSMLSQAWSSAKRDVSPPAGGQSSS